MWVSLLLWYLHCCDFCAFRLYLYLPNLSVPQLLFPLLLFMPHVLSLCVETSGYETVGWVSETSLSVCQSLRYISCPLPCIIDSLSLITVSSVTDEPLLPATPVLKGVYGSKKFWLRHNY